VTDLLLLLLLPLVSVLRSLTLLLFTCAVEQIAFADRILLNKTDLVSAEEKEKIKHRIKVNAGALGRWQGEGGRASFNAAEGDECQSRYPSRRHYHGMMLLQLGDARSLNEIHALQSCMLQLCVCCNSISCPDHSRCLPEPGAAKRHGMGANGLRASTCLAC
jgi:hypothetical protein